MRLADTDRIDRREDTVPDRGYLTGSQRAGREKTGPAGEKEETGKIKLERSEAVWEMLRRQAEAGREAAEKSEDTAADFGKVMEIARRIARGDQVPPKDEKKLMEYSTELYQMAKSAAMLSRLKKRRKHKSLFDEEKKQALEEKARALSGEESGRQSGGISAEESGEDIGTDGEGS